MLRRHPSRILINTLDANSFVAISGGAFIKGYGEIIAATVSNCLKICTVATTPKVQRITVSVPATCECPYEWPFRVDVSPNYPSYEVGNTFTVQRFYGWMNPDGSTPTNAQVATGVAGNINSDPNAEFVAGTFATLTYTAQTTAFVVGELVTDTTSGATAYVAANSGSAATGTLTLAVIQGTFTTADTLVGSQGGAATANVFTATAGSFIIISKENRDINGYTPAGTVTTLEAFATEQLTTNPMARIFPILQGSFGSLQQLPIRGGSYCKYSFTIRQATTAGVMYDDAIPNALQGYEQEVEFYVNINDPLYATEWHTPIVAAFPACTTF